MAETPGVIIDPKRPLDGRLWTNASARPLGTIITFTSDGDDPEDPTSVGGGESLVVDHHISDPTTQTVYFDLNVKENRTFLHEGYVAWKDAVTDTLTLCIVPTVTVNTPGTNTNYNIAYGVIIPAAGNGTVVVQSQDIRLVEMPDGLDYADPKPAFWNADYDSQTHTFSNMTPAPYGNGRYNMFPSEVHLGTFAQRLRLLGSGNIPFRTNDTFEIGHNMRILMTCVTKGTDHDWSVCGVISLFRQKIAMTSM